MALFWIAHREGEDPHIMVVEASALLMARLRASIAGLKGGYAEGYQLSPSMARKVPKRLTGRPLSKARGRRAVKSAGGQGNRARLQAKTSLWEWVTFDIARGAIRFCALQHQRLSALCSPHF